MNYILDNIRKELTVICLDMTTYEIYTKVVWGEQSWCLKFIFK